MTTATPKVIQSFLLKHISKHPQNIVAFAATHFSVSRMTIHRHLQKLSKTGKIIQTGRQRGTQYFLQSSYNKELFFDITSKLSEYNVWDKYFNDQYSKLKKNVFDICNYGFTEIFNNAIDHSQGKKITVKTHCNTNNIVITIADDGIGIFKKLQTVFGYKDMREGILNLSKGKLTTDPTNHTGEGIFFTSKAFDSFGITANSLLYFRDNHNDDWIIESNCKPNQQGTVVKMEINVNSANNLIKLFKQFQNPETLEFNKTHILVELSKFKEESFISRSQAKRIIFGLEKFHHVILDFKNVTTVGQGFVDEIFRIFKNKYPHIEIHYRNASNDVKFMIKRGIATAKHNDTIGFVS
jgi:hypothetical protein